MTSARSRDTNSSSPTSEVIISSVRLNRTGLESISVLSAAAGDDDASGRANGSVVVVVVVVKAGGRGTS